jgi:alkylation response protein AidB-like acyl-CoA dehydrogenase
VKERHAFGTSIGFQQNTRSKIAEVSTEIDIART